MNYNKISKAAINKVAKRYGENSIEFRSINLIAECRLPYEALAELFRMDPDVVKTDLSGGTPLDQHNHRILHNGTNVLLTTALKKGLLPCKDTSVLVPILEMMLFMEQATRELASLQQSSGE